MPTLKRGSSPSGSLLLESDDARNALLRGVDLVASTVVRTLGPSGSYVVLQRRDAPPLVTNDGVTIARSVDAVHDPLINQGVQLLKQASEVSELSVGDGTTTATVIARSLLSSAFRHVAGGADPSELVRGLERGIEAVVAWLNERAEPLDRSKASIFEVARLAARDEGVAGVVAEALEAVGEAGVVRVEDSTEYGLNLRVMEGMRFDNGLAAPGLIVDPVRRESVFENPLVAIAEERLTQVSQLRALFEQVAEQRRPLVLIADEISGEALSLLILNVARRGMPVAAVKAPDFGPDRAASMRDIASWSGGMLFGEQFGRTLATAKIDELGAVERAIVTTDSTTLVGGAGRSEDVAIRVSGINAELRSTESEYEKTKLLIRLARLGGSVAVIGVGCDTAAEQEEIRHRVTDAVQAGKAALRGGMVPGGGTALLQAAEALLPASGQRSVADGVLAAGLVAPARQLATNAGIDAAGFVQRLRAMPFGQGIDLHTGDEGEMKSLGVRDPLEVTVAALVAAGSVARMGILCEVVIAKQPLPVMRRPHHEHGHNYHGDPEGHTQTMPVAADQSD